MFCVCVCVRACVLRACVRACERACVVCVVFCWQSHFMKNSMQPSFIPFAHIQISLHNIVIYGSFTEKGLSAWAKLKTEGK